MSHHINHFMKAGFALARVSDEAMLLHPPEVTLWFKNESDLARYCLYLHKKFDHLLTYTPLAHSAPASFRAFTFAGVKFTLEVEPK